MKKLLGSGHTVVIYDEDTPEVIVQKIESAQYIIDMRTDITVPLEKILKDYLDSTKPTEVETPKLKEPKYKFNIGE